MGNDVNENRLKNFIGDLMKIMIKHDVKSFETNRWNAGIKVENEVITVFGVDFILNEDQLEIGHLNLDECLDMHNQLVHAFNATKEPSFLEEANEVMAYIKRRFWEVEA